MQPNHHRQTLWVSENHSANRIRCKGILAKVARLALLTSLLTTLAAVPALAQNVDDEISELREEVAELRALVAELLREKERQDDLAEPVERLSPSQSESDVQSSSVAGLKTGPRQPVGRFPDDAFVTAGSFDRSINVPGTNGAIRIGGALQVDANFDTDHQGFQQIGTPPTIPLDGTVDDGDEQFAIHARHTRVNFDYRAPTDLGEFRTFIEFDFFGDGDEFTNDYDLRLRHAAAELGPWKLGQFWS